MQYFHTQHGRFHYGLYVAVAANICLAWLIREQPALMWLVLGVAVLLFLFTQAFHYLTVRDEGDALAICFGPLPLFGERIHYSDVTAAQPGRTSFLDGWGVHWVPGRGTTYNIWGFDCVVVRLGKRVIRIGTDDADNLVALLRAKMGQPD